MVVLWMFWMQFDTQKLLGKLSFFSSHVLSPRSTRKGFSDENGKICRKDLPVIWALEKTYSFSKEIKNSRKTSCFLTKKSFYKEKKITV